NMMLAPVFTGLIAGTVYMLLIAKVKKQGAITLVGLLMSCFFFLSGHYILSFIPSIVCSVVADYVAKIGKYESKGFNLLSYILFSFGNLGPIILMWFMRESYIQRLLDKGKDWTYIHNVMIDFTVGNVFILLFAVGVCAFIGGVFGQYIVKKHFVKAGMVS
ncbi:MAG: MptD family putative ECF transporter S component, partial [Culicoidibacterales bacterium]